MARDPEAGKPKPRKRPSSASKQSLSWRDVREILLHESHENLVTALLEWAQEDKALRERLLNFAARRAGPEAAVTEAVRAMEKAIGKPGRYIDYRAAREWARNVNRAIDNIEQLLVEGHSAVVVDLCESALQQLVSKLLNGVDDSDGYFAEMRDRLEAMHLAACERFGPDPVALARRLLEYETTLDFDVFLNALERYEHLLQDEGLQEYRRLAEAAWAKVPARTEQDLGLLSNTGLPITRIMLRLASGDREELVAVLSRDLSFPQKHLAIAKIYQSAKQPDKGLAWAERGIKAFPEQPNEELREFAAELYHQLGRHADAVEAVWLEFVERPKLQSYQLLQKHAERAKAWPHWRERALAGIRGQIAQAKQKSMRWGNWANHSLLAEIYLYEGDTEAAWREAQIGGCSSDVWLRLTELREKEHPAEVGAVYLKLVEQRLEKEQNGRYDDVVNILRKAARLMRAAGRNREFLTALYRFCARYRSKRNFTKLVNDYHKELFGE